MLTDTKLIAFVALLAVQVFVSFIYKISQIKGTYTYSPLSVIASSELIKLCMSIIALNFQVEVAARQDTTSMFSFVSQRLAACLLLIKTEVNRTFIILTCGLALLYLINNQLAFVLFLHVDMASISMFKSFSTFISAILLWAFFERRITREQWASIILQVIGLCIVQYDGCKNVPILAWKYYFLLIGSTCITAISSVSNERLIKTFAVNIHIQNTILYSFGFVFNLGLFVFLPDLFITSGTTRKQYFDGYSLSVLAIIVCNSLLGIVITLVYKYADAIVKTFSTACATGVLLYINVAVFHLKSNLNVFLGAIVIFISSYLFLISPSKSTTSSDEPTETQSTFIDRVNRIRVKDKLKLCPCYFMSFMVGSVVSFYSVISLLRHGSVFYLPFNSAVSTNKILINDISLGYPVIIHGHNLCSNDTLNLTDIVINGRACYPIEHCSNAVISCYLRGSLRKGFLNNEKVKIEFVRLGTKNSSSLITVNTTVPYTKLLSHWEKNNIILVIHFNRPSYDRLPLFDLYHDIFPLVVFTGPKNHSQIIYCPEGEGGYRAYTCLSRAITLYPNYNGYFMVHFDLLPILYNLKNFTVTSIWSSSINCVENPTTKTTGWVWWDADVGAQALKRTFEELKNNSHNITHHQRYLKNYREHIGEKFCGSFSDLFYLPKRYTSDWLILGEILGRHRVFLEMGFATMSYMIIQGNLSSSLEIFKGIDFGGGPSLSTLSSNPWMTHFHRINLALPKECDLINIVIQRSFPKHSNISLA